MATLYSTTEAAEKLGCTRQTVYRWCVAKEIGIVVGNAMFGLSDRDIRRLKRHVRDKPGNPNFVPGNHFGGGRPPKRRRRRRKSQEN